jgi:hypothetical protein
MGYEERSGTNRRQFLATIVPACAIACLGCSTAFAQSEGKTPARGDEVLKDVHPFDAEYPKKLTYRQVIGARYRESIQLAKALQEDIGKEKAIDFLKSNTRERMLDYGKSQTEKSNDHSLHAYTEQFRNVDNYKNTLVMEIVEDSEEAFELKVTECLWASTFRDADAGDIGYAMVCYGDYAWAEGFSSKIEMVRDKTLMEGAPFCNHRYVSTG